VPYLVRGGERFFERREVRESVFLLRGAARAPSPGGPEDPGAGGLRETVVAVLTGIGFTAAPPAGTGAARERWESLAAIVRLAEQHAGDLSSFVAELDERAAMQHAPVADGVTLASLHAAKGLEWDAVFLVGLADGTLPIVYAETADQLAEEKRLLYVGITRARQVLALSWAAARSPGARASRRPSRFLAELAPSLADSSLADSRAAFAPPRDRRARRQSGSGGPPRCRVCRRALTSGAERKLGRCGDCPSEVDEALFARLRAWRLERSQELKQPAFCVFTDATLTRIAEVRPSTREELSRIGGVGPAKLASYADDVLALCGEHARPQ
jgi:DNA helicase-2/ATP-dependent DNA helicase PcrA